MDSLYEQLKHFSDIGSAVSLAQMLISLGLSFLLSTLVAKLYQYTYRGASYSPAFMQTLVICGMVVAMVMLIIGSNIARAFSLVGALSIIRFRNAVKDPRDVAFIFFVMAIGMGCGTGFYLLTVVFTLISGALTGLLSAFKFGEADLQEKILKISTPPVSGYEKMFDEVLHAHSKRYSLISVASSRMGTEMELTYALTLPGKLRVTELVDALSKLNQQLRVEIAGTNHTIDL